ncbi:MAG: GNAT family N-acetyltransferase [bacterium]
MTAEVRMRESFIHRESTLRVFRDLFLKGYGLSHAVVEPDRLVHWQAQTQDLREKAGLEPSPLGRIPTLVFGGYFYNFSSPAPSSETIAAAIDEAKRLGARQLLVPTVRDIDDSSDLTAAGFRPLPCFVESIARLGPDLDADLRARVGADRFRQIKRMVRRVERQYEFLFLRAADMEQDSGLVAEIARLHGLNISQHDFGVNFFRSEALQHVLQSPLRDRLLVGMRCDRGDGAPRQAVITLLCEETGELFALAQGIDHEHVAREMNLYITLYYRLYEYGAAHGAHVFHLGRGAQDEKRRLGANRYVLLNHWMKSDEPGFAGEIERLALAMRKILVLKTAHYAVECRGPSA